MNLRGEVESIGRPNPSSMTFSSSDSVSSGTAGGTQVGGTPNRHRHSS